MLKKACADTTSCLGSMCTPICGWGGHGYSWACSLAWITVLDRKLYVSLSPCTTEINPSFFVEEPATILCKVIGNVARAGRQLSPCWQGGQRARGKENVHFSQSLGPSSTEQNRQSQNVWCTWPAVFAPDSPLCGYDLYMGQNPHPSDGAYINPVPSDVPWNFRVLGNRDMDFTFSLGGCLLHREMGFCFVPVPNAVGFHGITRSTDP